MKSELAKELDVLISKYVEKRCSPQEKRRLYELLASSSNETCIIEVLSEHLQEFTENQYENENLNIDAIYKRLISEINKLESGEKENTLIMKKQVLKRTLFRAAAVAAVFIIAFLLGINYHRVNSSLAGPVTGEDTFTEVKAPIGSRSVVKLPDGTEIMLNAGSSIRYNKDYNFSHRNITLEGEGYFTVAKNIDLPLVVKAGNIYIRAVGTEFNVKAYSEEAIIETTLVTGEIEILHEADNNNNNI